MVGSNAIAEANVGLTQIALLHAEEVAFEADRIRVSLLMFTLD
jgi:hypothetical protein